MADQLKFALESETMFQFRSTLVARVGRVATSLAFLASLIFVAAAPLEVSAQKKGGNKGGNNGGNGAKALRQSGKFDKVTAARPQNQTSVGLPAPRLGVGQPNPYSTNRYGNPGGQRGGHNHGVSRGSHQPSNGGNRLGTNVYFNYNSGLGLSRGFGVGSNSFVRSGLIGTNFGYTNYTYGGFPNSVYRDPFYYQPTTVLRTPIIVNGTIPYAPNIDSQFIPNGFPSDPVLDDQFRGAYGYEEFQRQERLRQGFETLPPTDAQVFRPQVPTTALARNLQRDAEQAFYRGDYETANVMVARAMSLDRDNGYLMLFASQAQFAIGDFENSIASVDAATATLPRDQWGFVVTNFRQFYGKNDYVTQTNRLNEVILRRPNDAGLLTLRGFHYGLLGHQIAATADFQRALESNPNDSLANRLLLALGVPPAVIPEAIIQAPIPVAPPVDPNAGIIRLISPTAAPQESINLLNPPK